MPLIVDAYNVVHQTGVLPPGLAGMDVAELAMVLPRTRFAGDLVTLVCDGIPAAGQPRVADRPGVRVRYAGGGMSADDLIAAMVNRSSAPRSLTIVSSDREVQRAGRRRRCGVLPSDEFLRRIAEDLHGLHLDALAAEEERGGPGARRAGTPTPPIGVPFPPEMLAEAAEQRIPPPTPAKPREPEPEPAPPTPTPPPTPKAEPAKPPAPPPIFDTDLLAEVLEMAREDEQQRAAETARRREAQEQERRRREAEDAEAARREGTRRQREAAEAARRDAEAERLAREAEHAIGQADLAAIEHLLDRAVPAESRPRRDRTFDESVIAEIEQMIREFEGEGGGGR